MVFMLSACKEEVDRRAPKPPKPTGDVYVYIDKYLFALPRDSDLSLSLYDGQTLYPYEEHVADRDHPVKVKTARNAEYSITDISDMKQYPQGTYGHYKQQIEEAEASGLIKIHKNGMKEILVPGPDFIFPDSIKSKDGKPIVISCTGEYDQKDRFGWCRAGYVHPLGFSLNYKFPMSHVPQDQILVYDRALNKRIESYIIDTK